MGKPRREQPGQDGRAIYGRARGPSCVPLLHGLPLAHYLATGAMLFCLGVIGFVSRRNLIIMFLCTEMMFQGVAVSLAAFSAHHLNPTGQTFVIFVLTIAAGGGGAGAGAVVLLFRRRARSMRWRGAR